ncbi:hypothetical protein CRG98_021358 [Punica granatum]|uniref:Uncharacterized protein n=1 Tax=Punica granatum TaxID=22663 RepID=A0A2I0JS16_PUNGR|nr:hypothetical protein CRG98_021358 [Punica granatum]
MGASANPRGGRGCAPSCALDPTPRSSGPSHDLGVRPGRVLENLAGGVDVESAHWMRKGSLSASAGTSCRPPSYLITRPGNMSVLPKWLRRGTPTIPGHPVIMGPPRFHRATHRKRTSVNSRQKRLHSEKLRSGGGMTSTRH